MLSSVTKSEARAVGPKPLETGTLGGGGASGGGGTSGASTLSFSARTLCGNGVSGPGPTAQNRKAGADHYPKRPHRGPLEARGSAGSCSPAAQVQALGYLAPSPARRTSQMGNRTWGGWEGADTDTGVRPGPWPLKLVPLLCHPPAIYRRGRNSVPRAKIIIRQARHAFLGQLSTQRPHACSPLKEPGFRESLERPPKGRRRSWGVVAQVSAAHRERELQSRGGAPYQGPGS